MSKRWEPAETDPLNFDIPIRHLYVALGPIGSLTVGTHGSIWILMEDIKNTSLRWQHTPYDLLGFA